MDINHYTKEVQLADGRTISIETGKLARQAHGSVVLTMGNTKLLATVVSEENAKDEIDFMPLSVDYQEKFASAGKIPGGFSKREGKLSDHEILTSRLVDRAIRPLFPKDYHSETQINIYLISADTNVMPDALAAFAASSALSVSDIPFNGPISEVRVIRKEGEFIVNPSPEQMEGCDIDLMVGASEDHILMVEGEMLEVSEAEMVEAIRVAHDAIKPQCQLQKALREEIGLTYRTYEHEIHDETLEKEMFDQTYDQMYAIASSATADKALRKANFKKIKEDFIAAKEATLAEGESLNSFLVNQYFGKVQKKAARNATLNEKKRLDGRAYDEIRPIWCEVNYLPSAHGSAVFTRGETQSLTSLTLGTKMDEQIIDTAMFNGTSSFLLHYNFPAFSTGEARPNRAPGRREIGHGNLAFRALKAVIPPKEVTPYTLRLVSDILESNGSSSMATVCAGTLALMDAGIPIKAPVAGIAMGLITDSASDNYAVLSDILGDEDHLGDMDFKVTGTSKGITACQMDIKVGGLSYEILEYALGEAKKGREHILGEMLKALDKPREEMKPHAPRNKSLVVPAESIGAIIGPGGKIIQEIQRESGATVVIEEKSDGGHVNIFATNDESMQKALQRIRNIVAVPNVGEIYDGIVKSVVPFGAFVEFMPGKEGLLHISEIKRERLESMDGVLEIGEEIKIKLIGIDKKSGKFKLSRKVLLPKE